MREYFDAVVSGKEVEHGKPALDIFLLAAGCTAIMIPDVLAPPKVNETEAQVSERCLPFLTVCYTENLEIAFIQK